MLPRLLFWAVLVAICGYAFARGTRDERLAAAACLIASVLTHFAVSPLQVRYSGIEGGLVAIDIAMLVVFVAIALRSHRFWPLWVAGLQLTMSMAHVMKAVDLQLMPRAYAAAAVFWSYPILLIIFVGAWRSHRRTLADQSMAGREPNPAV
jgi:hypothetical protein